MYNVINFRQVLHNSRLFRGVISEPSEFVLISWFPFQMLSSVW